MGLVRVGGDNELVPSLRPPHSQLIADTVGVLRRDLPGKEGLAYLVAEHVPVRLLLPARGGSVPAFPQEKFSVHRGRVTFISGDIFPFFRLDRVLPIVGTVLYGLRHGEPRRGLAFHQPRGGYGPSLLPASGQLGLLAAVAGHDLIAAVLTGPYNGGLGDALVLDAGDHSPHFLVVADLEGMVLEGVELGQLQVDDLLVPPAGRLRGGLGRLFRLCGRFGLRRRLCRLLGLGRFLRLCCLPSR